MPKMKTHSSLKGRFKNLRVSTQNAFCTFGFVGKQVVSVSFVTRHFTSTGRVNDKLRRKFNAKNENT
jgi:hypothetical protein